MNETTSSPVRCSCEKIEELIKANAKLVPFKEAYNELLEQHIRTIDTNRKLREDNAQLKHTIVGLCDVVKALLEDVT